MADPTLPSNQSLFDLSGMTPSEARDYLVSLTAHLKQTEADLVAADQDVQLWTSRVALADQQGLADLRNQAEAQRVGAIDRRTKLQLEVWEFREGVEKMKKQLTILPLAQRTVNTDALLETLAHLAGPLDPLGPMAKQAEAETALAALKKRLSEKN